MNTLLLTFALLAVDPNTDTMLTPAPAMEQGQYGGWRDRHWVKDDNGLQHLVDENGDPKHPRLWWMRKTARDVVVKGTELAVTLLGLPVWLAGLVPEIEMAIAAIVSAMLGGCCCFLPFLVLMFIFLLIWRKL